MLAQAITDHKAQVSNLISETVIKEIQVLNKTVMEVGVAPDKVLSALEAGKYVEIDGWGLSDQIGQGVFWLTTPYGIDCMWYELTLAGCKKCLKRIEEHVDEGREF